MNNRYENDRFFVSLDDEKVMQPKIAGTLLMISLVLPLVFPTFDGETGKVTTQGK